MNVQEVYPGARPIPFGHLGDSNLHYNVSQPAPSCHGDPPCPEEGERFIGEWGNISRSVHSLVASFGGSISAEHGVGLFKVLSVVSFTALLLLPSVHCSSLLPEHHYLLYGSNYFHPNHPPRPSIRLVTVAQAHRTFRSF